MRGYCKSKGDGDTAMEILQGKKRGKSRPQHGKVADADMNQNSAGRAGGGGLVSRLHGNTYERTMRRYVVSNIHSSGREREVAQQPQHDGKGTTSVASAGR